MKATPLILAAGLAGTALLTATSCGSLTPAEAALVHVAEAAGEAAACAGLKATERALPGLPEGVFATVCALEGDPQTTAANEVAVRAAVAALPAKPARNKTFTASVNGARAGKIRDQRADMGVKLPVPVPPDGGAGDAGAADAGRDAR
jgi:hypothetical protein